MRPSPRLKVAGETLKTKSMTELFTKGPWRLNENGIIENSADDLSLHHPDRPEIERIANAALIAAAPAMYEALKLAAGLVKDWVDYNRDQIDSFDHPAMEAERRMQTQIANDLTNDLRKIRAALAAANPEITVI